MVKTFKLPFRTRIIIQRTNDFLSLGVRITRSKWTEWNWSFEVSFNSRYRGLQVLVKMFNLYSDLYVEPGKIRWNSELIARYLGELFDPSEDEEFAGGGPYPPSYKYQGVLGTHVCFND